VAVDSYLLFALLGPPLGFLFVVVAAPLLIYSFCARNQRRRFIASKIALVLSLLAVLVSAVLWLQLVTGYYRYSNPVDYGDPQFVVYEVIAALEALALLASILSAVRQRARRPISGKLP
jgi:biotin transporter BioY